MAKFQFHTIESAPKAAKPALEDTKNMLGFVPSLYAGLAEAPAALEAYQDLADIFQDTTLSTAEQHVVLLATSVENGCEFCVAAHSFVARNVVKLNEADIQALRDNTELPTQHLQEIAHFTRLVVRRRGLLEDASIDQFLAAGFTRANVLEVTLGVAMKTLSNYANHVLKTPTDAAFAADVWRRAA